MALAPQFPDRAYSMETRSPASIMAGEWRRDEGSLFRSDPRNSARSARCLGARGTADAAALGGRTEGRNRRSLLVTDGAQDLPRRPQAQPRRRQMAGLRGGLPRVRAALGARDVGRRIAGANDRHEADPPLGQ